MNGFKLVVPIAVRFSDCDPLGHLNNSVFFTLLEEARFAWLREVFGDDGARRHPIILGEATCTFRAPALPGEALAIGIRVERIGRASFDHLYRIESAKDGLVSAASAASPVPRGSGRLIAEAKTTGVGYDYEKNSSRELGPEFRAAIEKHQGVLKG